MDFSIVAVIWEMGDDLAHLNNPSFLTEPFAVPSGPTSRPGSPPELTIRNTVDPSLYTSLNPYIPPAIISAFTFHVIRKLLSK
jgi:hypothetical protein